MAKSRSRRDANSTDTQKIGVSSVEGKIQNYDPALVSLFAKSVGKIQMQSTCS